MIIVGRTILAIMYIVAVILSARYYLHILQAGGYRLRDYFTALSNDPVRWLPLVFSIIPTAMLSLGYSVAGFIFAVVYFLLIYTFYQKIVKILHLVPQQRFEATHRILRLSVTLTVLWTALVVIILILKKPARTPALVLSSLWFSLSPFFVALSVVINVPLEKRVKNYYAGLARRKIEGCPDLIVIGVTGSYGKTTVKDAIAGILSTRYQVLKTPGSYNTRMGIARTIHDHLTPEHQYFVCEMGARQVGEIQELCDMVRPNAGIITAVGSRHIDTFHSVRNILKARYELLDSVDTRGGQMFVNGDNMMIRSHMRYPDAITYGFTQGCSYHGTLLEQDTTGSTFSVTGPDGQYGEYHTKLLGRYNLVDLMGAIAVGNQNGIPMEDMCSAIAALSAEPHRLKMTRTGRRAIIDDTDNTYPDAVAVSLETLSMFENTRILITPGITSRAMSNEEVMQFAQRAARSADYIILLRHSRTRAIYENIIETGFKSDHILVVDTMADARVVASQIEPDSGSVVLLENSLPKQA